MPFGFKNARATYQQLVNCVFKGQVGRKMEVYIDDLLVKSGTMEQHLNYLREAFSILRQYQLNLNQAKCAFDVGSGKFLGFMVSKRRIEANP